MISNEIKEKLLQKNWYVDCKTEQNADLLLQACDESGITWCTGCKATERKSYKRYPVEIGFCNEDKGLTHSTTEDYKDSECENITDWFFNAIKNNDDNGKLTPQNAEQEHWVQIILARIRGIPIESFSTLDGTWVDDRNNSLIFMNCEYRIKQEPASTPLPISREIWSHLNKRWKYAAMESDGRIFFYNTKPTRELEYWSTSSDMSNCPLNINTYCINWETSLTERPKDV